MPYEGEKKREYQRRYMQARREKAIAYLGGKCVTCECESDLEFDHVLREDKTRTISSLLSGRWERLRAELDVCQLLCESCHSVKTVGEQTRPLEHGSYYRGYRKGCGCSKCRGACALRARVTRSGHKFRDTPTGR